MTPTQLELARLTLEDAFAALHDSFQILSKHVAELADEDALRAHQMHTVQQAMINIDGYISELCDTLGETK